MCEAGSFNYAKLKNFLFDLGYGPKFCIENLDKNDPKL